MKEAKSTESPKAPGRMRPGLTPESNENQCISLAMDIAKQKLLDGTASNSMILHFLKLGSTREQMEREKMEHEMELAKAKVEALESQAKVEQLYAEAMRAMQRYSGYDGVENDNGAPY